MSNEGREFSWDDSIENDSPDFVVLPEGDYDFEVMEFERARHNGSDKLPPCNKAIVHIKIQGAGGTTTVKHNLFLHSIMEGKLCDFFTGVGQRKRGDKVTMNWNAVVGAKGRCKVGIHKWTNDKGTEMIFNEIKKFYDPEEGAPAKSFKAGSF
ncbi:MAG TPA: DUF669 domain-containing protein [Desulfosporosinus sp.]|nr:DUF669 domain-containing protein [Desulfosporosinus sp.]